MTILWRRTWEDDLTREDYMAWDRGRRVGRVYRVITGTGDRWGYFPALGGPGHLPLESRFAAMMALEDAWLSRPAATQASEPSATQLRQ